MNFPTRIIVENHGTVTRELAWDRRELLEICVERPRAARATSAARGAVTNWLYFEADYRGMPVQATF